VLLFAYGSNLAGREMAGWCPAARFVGPALLEGYRVALTRRSIRWGGGVADIVPDGGGSVWGVVYAVPAADLDELDRKEGEGFAYRRRPVDVLLAGEQREAEAYEVMEKLVVVPPATPEYAALVLGGARERGLPAAWLGTLESLLGAGSVPGP
jgi:gamma-glutamylcyclotransferase (GGCT)/AIG2-like uncharacterized protein YtfP